MSMCEPHTPVSFKVLTLCPSLGQIKVTISTGLQNSLHFQHHVENSPEIWLSLSKFASTVMWPLHPCGNSTCSNYAALPLGYARMSVPYISMSGLYTCQNHKRKKRKSNLISLMNILFKWFIYQNKLQHFLSYLLSMKYYNTQYSLKVWYKFLKIYPLVDRESPSNKPRSSNPFNGMLQM